MNATRTTERISVMPRMTVTGQRIESPVTDSINRQTTAYRAWFNRRHAEFIAAYHRELEQWFSMTDEQRFSISCRMLAAGHEQNPAAKFISPLHNPDRINALADADVAYWDAVDSNDWRTDLEQTEPAPVAAELEAVK
jgi:hypothetical protein